MTFLDDSQTEKKIPRASTCTLSSRRITQTCSQKETPTNAGDPQTLKEALHPRPNGVQDLSTRRNTTSEFRVTEKMLEVSGESIIPRVSGRTRDTRERQQAL